MARGVARPIPRPPSRPTNNPPPRPPAPAISQPIFPINNPVNVTEPAERGDLVEVGNNPIRPGFVEGMGNPPRPGQGTSTNAPTTTTHQGTSGASPIPPNGPSAVSPFGPGAEGFAGRGSSFLRQLALLNRRDPREAGSLTEEELRRAALSRLRG